jgi:predicted nucleotidyltransferase
MALSLTLPNRKPGDRTEADAIRRYRARVLAAFPGQVERIVLFGSRVRGDLHENSDWDFAVYLDHAPDKSEQERMRDISHALGDETDAEVQSFLFGPEPWTATDELACNIRDEGMIIYGEDRRPMIERPVLQHARDALAKAERLAAQAEQAMPEAYETVVHNSYFAMFHAARGALLAVQARASTNHGQVVATFTRMVRRKELGQEATDLAATLTEAYKLRVEADYRTVGDLTEQGRALRAQVRPFLALCTRLVEERARPDRRRGPAMAGRRSAC